MMKIRVANPNGTVENITLTEPVTIERGDPLNALRTSTGMRFYFRQDGLYDGWEAEIGAEFKNVDEAKQFLREFTGAVEADREVFLPPPREESE